ncbi:MAG: TonB-dependent receptor [Chitinophagaceae bacterium]|nr:TonB-dependent receptor [Chitinophagaceae bacterium]
MRKSFSFLALFLAILVQAEAQTTTGRITGTIQDGGSKSLPSATITLLKAKDSSSVKFSVANKSGDYEFVDIREGKYLVSVTSVGYDRIFSASFEISAAQPEVNLGVLKMTESAKGLGGVTVTAKRPFIETKIDKTIVNVEASPTSAGATALEVLEKSPGISVDNDGNISLRGKAGVIVMMDGKPTYLSAGDLANLLKNTPASALDQIEIMTNPSARYDASGNSGVINIKTKKGRAGGFNGSIMVGLTTSFFETPEGTFYVIPKSQNSFTFNYRKNKINLFGNYNPNAFRGRNRLEIFRNVLDQNKNIVGVNEVETRFKFGNNNHTVKLGMDYFANKKSTFGVVVSGFTFSGHPTPQTETNRYDANGNLFSTMISATDNRIKFRNLTTNLNFRHVFDTTGRELGVDFDYIAYDNVSNMLLETSFFNGSGQPNGSQLQLRGHLPSKINIYSFKSDYTHPLKNGRIEAGVKSSFVKNDNVVEYVRWDGAKWVGDSRSNHFIYDENINAAYLNGNTQVKKWSFQAGLRLENTIAKGYQVTNDSTFKRNFTNLFPSAFVSYALNKTNQLTVSYSRRITRPNYQDLNPFIYFLDSLSYRKGNPFLLPQFTHNIELSHSFKSKLITTLNYNTTKAVISQILKPDGDLVFLTADNVSKFRNIGIAITAPLPLTKWWNLNLFTNIYNNKYDFFYNGQQMYVSFTSFMVNMTQMFTFKKGLTAEISGFYRAKGVEQLSINEPMYVVSFGGQKQVMKGKGTVRLNLRDPFWIQRYRGSTKYDIVDTRVQNRWDNRQVTATFTYRFGKSTQQNQPPRRRNSASQDEQNRVGSGGQ